MNEKIEVEGGQTITVVGRGRDFETEPMGLHELTKNMTEEEKKRIEEYFSGDVMSTMSISNMYPSMLEDLKEPVPIKMSRTEKRKLQRKKARELKRQEKQLNTIHKNIKDSSI
jgi:hypothetical protein